MAVVGLDGSPLQVNRALCEMLGYSEEELGRLSGPDVTHPDDLPASEAERRQLLAGEIESYRKEKRYIHKRGHFVWGSLSVSLVRHPDGSPRYLLCQIEDITERKRADEALRTREQRFRALTEHSSDLVSLLDADGTFLYLGPSCRAILGYDPDELIGRNAFELLHAEEPESAGRDLRRLLQLPGTQLTVEYRYPHRDGSWRWFEGVARNLLHQPGVQAIIVNSRDITDRKKSWYALQDSEARLKAILDASPDIITIVDRDGRLLELRGSTEWVRTPHEELIGRSIGCWLRPEDYTAVTQAVEQVLATGRMQSADVTVQRKEGMLHLEFSIVPWGANEVLGSVRDVTARRRAEEALRIREVELAHVDRLATMGEMTAVLAHELNQPLSAILSFANGCVRRIRQKDLASHELLPVLEKIAAQATRAADVIRHLRQFVGKKQPQRRRVAVNDMVNNAVELARLQAQRLDIGLRVNLGVGMPPVMADQVLIEQVVLNLLRNAMEAMGDRGDHDGGISVLTATPDASTVEVAVSDSGPGIQTLGDAAYDAFVTTKADGLGLGLTLCQSIVKAHGGRLWFTPNPVRGTTFRFTLPVAEARAASRAQRTG